MDPELAKILRETFKLTQENNRLLQKVRGYQKREDFLRMLKWVVIIGIGVGAFYFLQPYVDVLKNFIEQSKTFINDINGIIPKI